MITSCGRLDLLKNTILTLDKYNTYPIKKVIITEDAGKLLDDVIPEHWKSHTKVIVNEQNLGQLACIDLAYKTVDTAYVFHCEDDWEFYREGFIEDSLVILEHQPDVLLVWLRSFHHDVVPRYPFHYLGEKHRVGNVVFYELKSNNDQWRGFTFNPSLRRLADHKKISPVSRFASGAAGESMLSQEFDKMGMKTAILENDAVAHTGFGRHVMENSEAAKYEKKKKIRQFKYIMLLILGVFFGKYFL